MAVFIDTFVNKIDRKGRVSVPATFRAALAAQAFQGIVAFPSFKFPALHCAGMDWMSSLIESTANVDLFSPEHDDLTASLFSDAKQLPFDGEGRVLLPESLCAHAKLGQGAAADDEAALRGKLAACRFFYRHDLPKVQAWLQVVASRDDTCRTMAEEGF